MDAFGRRLMKIKLNASTKKKKKKNGTTPIRFCIKCTFNIKSKEMPKSVGTGCQPALKGCGSVFSSSLFQDVFKLLQTVEVSPCITSGLWPTEAPVCANFSCQIGTFSVAGFFSRCSGAKSAIFPLQLGTTCDVNHQDELGTN